MENLIPLAKLAEILFNLSRKKVSSDASYKFFWFMVFHRKIHIERTIPLHIPQFSWWKWRYRRD